MKKASIGAGCSDTNLATTDSVGLGRGGLIQETDDAYTINMIEFEKDEINSENDEGIGEIENNDCGIIENVLHKNVAEDQIYINKETLTSVMKNYALHKKFQFKVKRSSATRYHFSCVDDNCDWSFKSSAVHMGKIFKVRHFNDVHTCSFSERYLTQRQATSVVVAGFVVDKLSNSKRNYTPKDIISDMQRDHGVKLNYMKVWRDKEKAMEIVRGKPSVSYGELPSYLYMLEYTNPGKVTRLHKSDERCFLYVFVSLYSSIKGWEHSRPIMVVDRSFLKAAYRGTILTACTLDVAGNILPLAFALVDSENEASWGWFFMQLKNTFGVREGMCIISDRRDSIQNATSTVYPEVPHCFCIYHLWNNVKDLLRKNKEKVRRIFFGLAKAYTIERFERYMNELNKIDRRVQPYLFNVGYERWSRVSCRVKRTIFITSNIAEPMNSPNKFARELPVRRLLEFLTKLMTQWSYENRKHATKSTELGKMYSKKLKKNMIASIINVFCFLEKTVGDTFCGLVVYSG